MVTTKAITPIPVALTTAITWPLNSGLTAAMMSAVAMTASARTVPIAAPMVLQIAFRGNVVSTSEWVDMGNCAWRARRLIVEGTAGTVGSHPVALSHVRP
jgi:hypothetical protein